MDPVVLGGLFSDVVLVTLLIALAEARVELMLLLTAVLVATFVLSAIALLICTGQRHVDAQRRVEYYRGAARRR